MRVAMAYHPTMIGRVTPMRYAEILLEERADYYECEPDNETIDRLIPLLEPAMMVHSWWFDRYVAVGDVLATPLFQMGSVFG